ncbi:putative secreted protein [Mycobacterium sp. OTB74]|nr:putative secreted protein [Mycobacterium sp. OTB74]
MTEPVRSAEDINVSGRQHEPISLPISDGPATGYSWRLELTDGVRQIEDGPPRTVDPAWSVGADRSGFLRVEADHPGVFVVTGRLERPWQPDQPARVVRITVTVAS